MVLLWFAKKIIQVEWFLRLRLLFYPTGKVNPKK